MKTVFSGIQPTGDLHLGNYLGAVRNWTAQQERFRSIFCVVDYHALTQQYEPKEMPGRVFDMVLDLLALGIDPTRSILFVQSMVPEHTELCWVFNNVTGFGDLERMTQFKDKSLTQPDNISAGLFDYPVLQAADILLYRAQLVPVGQDQVQHIELARRIARSFNHRWGKVFPECEALLTEVPKVVGLDGMAKMSKSLGNHIPLSATQGKPLRKLLARAVTDEKRVNREDPGNPDDCNVFAWHRYFSTADDQAWVREGCTTAGIGCVDCKGKLADTIEAHFATYHQRRAHFVARPDEVRDVLYDGAKRAREIAVATMDEVRQRLGLWR